MSSLAFGKHGPPRLYRSFPHDRVDTKSMTSLV